MEHQSMRILFDSRNEKYKKPFGAVKAGQVCCFNILVPESCPAEKVFLVTERANNENRIEMQRKETENNFVRFGTEMVVDSPGLYFYWFYIEKQEGGFRLFKQGYRDINMEAGVLNLKLPKMFLFFTGENLKYLLTCRMSRMK